MKVLLTGGGTGGHIYPALALKKRIQEQYPDSEFLYIGTERGLESKIVPKNGVPFKAIKVEGFKRKLNPSGIAYNLNTIKLFLGSIRKARKLIRDFNPDVVIGTGGYVCAPVCYAASKQKIPTIIHEQNSVAGITNKFLARFVDKIAVCFEEARAQFKGQEHKVVFTGNPRAQEVALLKPDAILETFGLNSEKETVLIFGGSRGAQKINQTFMDSFEQLVNSPYQVLYVTGEIYYDEITQEINTRYKELSFQDSVKIVPYINDMPQVFASVSLVVGRSGATTLAELTSLGMPSILIPSPNVTEDHQTKNALSLVNKKAALMIRETELTAERFVKDMNTLMSDEQKRKDMAGNSKKMGKQRASDELIEVIQSIVN
ncbi:undecaprenyldiphospho-muramoylpentapeptide beta-N-acetylglucosaminyltransferase [Marinilactibacillus sp. XAAS-LB27]|uniref:undecaprenyldiphospho-muramoylpentapeptide beta-N-acetylglucosaminyltransferase n=1 Tax=Marinilactibacillus sp. XAAS-LB27 TaxID=3114538 RepID=UPI002E16D370|nr:undecaprenyldiphospho-muramoylpentapeptide beta-N-acetylglucosaminyltransferase [Marinilactibacillus sp. XAAS-LB27]